MFKKIIFISIIIFTICNCSSPQKNNLNKNKILFNGQDINSVNIKPSEINVTDSIKKSNYALRVGNKLVINEKGKKGLFHIINLENEKYEGLFGEKGRGPGEMAKPGTLTKVNDSILQIFDSQLKKIVQFNINSITLNRPIKKFKNEFSLKKLKGATAALILEDTVYSLNHYKSEHRIFSSNLNGEVLSGLGALPDNEEEHEGHIFAEAHPGRMQFKNDLFVISHLTTPLIQIINRKDRHFFSIEGPDHFPSIYKINNQNRMSIAYTEESRIGYSDIKISDIYIYALYNGKKLFDSSKSLDFNSNFLYVFKPDGSLVKKIVLDKGVLTFDIYLDRYLYGIHLTNEGQHKLLKYDIKI